MMALSGLQEIHERLDLIDWLVVSVYKSITVEYKGKGVAFTEESYSQSLHAHLFRMAHNESDATGGSTVPLQNLYTEEDVPGQSCMSHWKVTIPALLSRLFCHGIHASPCLPWYSTVTCKH